MGKLLVNNFYVCGMFLGAVLLSGCASDPLRAYTKKDGDVSVVMRADGGVSVQYSVSSEAGKCDNFEYIGIVSDNARSLPRSWFKNMPEKYPERSRKAYVSIDSEVRVKAYGSTTYGNTTCGPLIATFQPEDGKDYEIKYTQSGVGCRMDVYDVSEEDNQKVVPAKIRACPNPSSAASLFMNKDGRSVR